MKDKIVLSNPRIVWVDYYKVIGIFLIVLGHSIFRNSDLTKFLYIFHVPIFFFISGYLEKNNPCPTKEYLKKLLYSLIIPYFIWNILYFPFHLSFRSVIAMVVGLPPWNGASWFLMVLVFMTPAFLTNSDAHSPWPHRLGREFNQIELEDISYTSIKITNSMQMQT